MTLTKHAMPITSIPNRVREGPAHHYDPLEDHHYWMDHAIDRFFIQEWQNQEKERQELYRITGPTEHGDTTELTHAIAMSALSTSDPRHNNQPWDYHAVKYNLVERRNRWHRFFGQDHLE